MEQCPICKRMSSERNHYTGLLVCYNRFCKFCGYLKPKRKEPVMANKELVKSDRPIIEVVYEPIIADDDIRYQAILTVVNPDSSKSMNLTLLYPVASDFEIIKDGRRMSNLITPSRKSLNFLKDFIRRYINEIRSDEAVKIAREQRKKELKKKLEDIKIITEQYRV